MMFELTCLLLVAQLNISKPFFVAGVLKPAAAGGSASVGIASTNTATVALGVFQTVQNITVPSGANKILVLFAGGGDSVSDYRTPDSVVSDVDGSLTQLLDADDANFVRASVWYKINPTVGAHGLTVTWDGSFNTIDQAYVNSVVLTNAHQTTPFGSTNNTSGTGTAPTTSITLAANQLGFAFLSTDSGPTLNATTGTIVYKVLQVSSDTAYGVSTNTGSGSTAMTFGTDSEGYAEVAFSVVPP